MEEKNNQNINTSPELFVQPTKRKILIKIVLVVVGIFVVSMASFASYQHYQKSIKRDVTNKVGEKNIQADNKPIREKIKIEADKQNNKTCPPVKIDDNIVIDENSDEVADLLYRASRDGDYDYILPHMYCNELCQQTIFEKSGLCFDESVELDKWASEQERSVKLLELSSIPSEKTENMAKYEISYKLTGVKLNGEVEAWSENGKDSMELIKIGKRWKIDMGRNMEYTLALLLQYQMLHDNIQKCKKFPPIIYTAPISNGHLEISDPNHPLYGFSIDFPDLKEPLDITVSCAEKYLLTNDIFHVTLPVSIKYNKDYKKLMSEQDELLISINKQYSERKLTDKLSSDEAMSLMKRTLFRYTLPYYNVSFNDETGYAFAVVATSLDISRELTHPLFPEFIGDGIDVKNNHFSVRSIEPYSFVFGVTDKKHIKPYLIDKNNKN